VRVSAEPIIGYRLDHLVWAVPDLQRGAQRVRDGIGVEPAMGGSHVGLGTANYLLGLGADAYLEVIGPDTTQPQPLGARPFGVDELVRPRLVTFAVRVADIEVTINELRRLGHDPGESYAMQRSLPTGGVLWWRLTLAPDWGGGVVPFLIEWGNVIHPSRSCAQGARLERLRAQHPDPDHVRAVWTAMGLDYFVDAGPAARLEATVSGPGGSVTLGG
jgi:Glyoxalase-like domain